MASTNKLSFQVIPSNTCKTLVIADTSVYAGDAEGAVMQIMLPDRDEVVEVTYTRNSITVLNSNSLGYTNVDGQNDLQDLPDGYYTIKMDICPYGIFWYEKDYYRICKLECKYYQALLKLDVSKCQKCYNVQSLEKLALARVYMEGIVGNANNDNLKGANNLYKAASGILDNLLNECNNFHGKHCC